MRPDYGRIHELEYELGFRDDPPVRDLRDLRFGPGQSIPFSAVRPVQGRTLSPEQKAAILRRAKAAYLRRALDLPPVKHIPGRGHTNVFRNVTD